MKHLFYIQLLLLIIPLSFLAQTSDFEGSKDHPLVTRIDGFYISGYEENDFDSFNFKTDEGGVLVEGHKYVITYQINDGFTSPGKTKVMQNYINAIEAIGGKVLLKSSYYTVLKAKKNNMETWLKVEPMHGNDDKYQLTIVDKTIMEQDVVADAAIFAKGIEATGHIAIYGIYFDSGKSIVKSESESALSEITKLLKDKPSLKLYVVGHTDSDGSFVMNMDLSKKRAEAVVNQLVQKYQIDKNRLVSDGCGELCPVESNRSEEGKAKNRRVELVELL